MKYIFDFDDVLFHTTRRRLEHLYPFLEKMGISRNDINDFYEKTRGNHFSMKKLLNHFFSSEDLYEKAMEESEKFANSELINTIKKLGKKNCYILTYGDKEFQLDKIKRIGIENLFSEIIVVPTDEKKETIEKICAKHKKEKVVFVDDKAKHFENLDFKKCPNLTTILYNNQAIAKLLK
jgi:HAD superfamily hydrolase (TIGR01509 family)